MSEGVRLADAEEGAIEETAEVVDMTEVEDEAGVEVVAETTLTVIVVCASARGARANAARRGMG